MKKKLILLVSIPISLVILFFMLMHFGHEDVTRRPFVSKAQSSNNWNDVFKNPKEITLKTFKTGELDVQYSGLLNLKHDKAKKIQDKTVRIPVFAHVLKHNKFGSYLIDTGLDSNTQKKPNGNITGLLLPLYGNTGYQKKEQNIASILKDLKISLKGVFLSHLHGDHSSGALDLPSSISYYIGKGEVYLNYKYLYYCDFFKKDSKVFELDFTHIKKMPIVGKSIDFFGDGSLWAIYAPGHTDAFVAYLINGIEGPVLVLSDSCSLKKGFDMAIGPGSFSSNIAEGQKTLNKFITFKKKYPKVRLLYGHDK